MEYIIVIVLIAASGMFSGLTIGLMGYSVDEVERLAAVGDANAKKILPLVINGNLLLTTLLLGNTAVNA
ncbi:MAG: CNNM domain-containing protein, partial [Sulfurimonadaceae bacterium]|nr:CNNM domain-containing protein [Sulfurimonadaceae bacterium]